jgi:hypothetical protein
MALTEFCFSLFWNPKAILCIKTTNKNRFRSCTNPRKAQTAFYFFYLQRKGGVFRLKETIKQAEDSDFKSTFPPHGIAFAKNV